MCLLWHDISRLVLVANYKQCCLFTCEASYYHLAPSPGDTGDTDPPGDDLSTLTRGPGAGVIEMKWAGQQLAASGSLWIWSGFTMASISAPGLIRGGHGDIPSHNRYQSEPASYSQSDASLHPASHASMHLTSASWISPAGSWGNLGPGNPARTSNQHSDLVAALTINLGL